MMILRSFVAAALRVAGLLAELVFLRDLCGFLTVRTIFLFGICKGLQFEAMYHAQHFVLSLSYFRVNRIDL